MKTLWQKSKKSKQLRIRDCPTTEVFAIVAEGTSSNIGLPATFDYQDTMNSWRSETWTVEKSMDGNKSQTCAVDDLPTHFKVFQKIDTSGFERLTIEPIDHKGIVRMKYKSKNPLLDIKTRKRDTNSLRNQLRHMYSTGALENLGVICNNNGVNAENLPCAVAFKEVCQKIKADFPVSYQYPTISINSTMLPRPSNLSSVAFLSVPEQASEQLGAAASSDTSIPNLVNSFDNNAHMIFHKEGFQPESLPNDPDLYKRLLENNILHVSSEESKDSD